MPYRQLEKIDELLRPFIEKQKAATTHAEFMAALNATPIPIPLTEEQFRKLDSLSDEQKKAFAAAQEAKGIIQLDPTDFGQWMIAPRITVAGKETAPE